MFTNIQNVAMLFAAVTSKILRVDVIVGCIHATSLCIRHYTTLVVNSSYTLQCRCAIVIQNVTTMCSVVFAAVAGSVHQRFKFRFEGYSSDDIVRRKIVFPAASQAAEPSKIILSLVGFFRTKNYLLHSLKAIAALEVRGR